MGAKPLPKSAINMSVGTELALGGLMVTPWLEVRHADVCSLPNIAWRKQLQNSTVMNAARWL